MIDYSSLFISFVAFIAFFLKATTGFGPTIIVVSIGSLIIGSHSAVILSSILDLVGGMTLFHMTQKMEKYRFWLPLSVLMMIGAAIGGVILKFFPKKGFDVLLGSFVLILGVWFITGRKTFRVRDLCKELPESCSIMDSLVSLFAGFCGGLFGISGPVLLLYFGRWLSKDPLRELLIPIFLGAAFSRVITYSLTGLITLKTLTLALYSMPGLLLGLYIGNRVFFRLSEVWFNRIVGGVLIMSALRLMF